MSTCVNLIESTFKFKKENNDVILKTLKEFVSNTNDLTWIDKYAILDSENIQECFEEIGYPLYEEDGFFHIDHFEWEKFGDEPRLFDSIAKYIEKESYLEYSCEDGERFRLIFNGKNCKFKYPTLIWD